MAKARMFYVEVGGPRDCGIHGPFSTRDDAEAHARGYDPAIFLTRVLSPRFVLFSYCERWCPIAHAECREAAERTEAALKSYRIQLGMPALRTKILQINAD
jgi:hypothetical protein